MIDREKFYDGIRPLFGGALSSSQVQGINGILGEWEKRHPAGDLRWLAYMLATVKHETANTMQPIEEYGKGVGRSYGKPDHDTGQTYYGRGFVQITWKENYERFALRLAVDLVNQPSLALEPRVATAILFDGMEKGLFTGVGLPKYFDADTEDWVNARKIINALDKAELIAGYGRSFMGALK